LSIKEIAMLTSHDLNHLRTLAAPVSLPGPSAATLGPKGAARALSGVVRLVVIHAGQDVMQRACAKLARSRVGWSDMTGDIRLNGALAILSAAADGIAQVAGYDNVMAALAFWACETDPAVWRDVASAA
jgi:hypothetical protein